MKTVYTEHVESLKQTLRNQFETMLRVLDDDSVVRSAEDLRKTEIGIVNKTDTIASEIIKSVIIRSLQDETVVSHGRRLVHNAPSRMKNHGKRDVTIHPYRGNPFSIQATYYCRAGLSPKKGEKKGGSIQS